MHGIQNSCANLKNNYYKNSKSNLDYGKYSISRAEYILLYYSLSNIDINKMKLDFLHDLKSFYTFVSSKIKYNGYTTINKIIINGASFNDIICNMFADFFANTNVYNQYDERNEYPYPIASFLFLLSPVRIYGMA